ncbi:hypothetical protein RHS01_01153 [Rhizoctonia solani]|uniref:Uncharacterized protein n=1 Tax=Rhizoctonia solani TaxID=456999 RepID=A0A8H7M9D5_9AGAM|nr:hypothetical protein RHS01_01153 [Rhizoctonia solani]
MSTTVLSPPKSIPLSPSDHPPGSSHSPLMSSPELTEVNPVHLMATANLPASREVHLERADSAQIILRTGPQPDSLLERAERKLGNVGHAVSAAVHPHARSSDANKYGAMMVDSPRATSPTSLPQSDASGPIRKLYPTGPSFNPPPSPPASDEGVPQDDDVIAALHAQPRSDSPEPKLASAAPPTFLSTRRAQWRRWPFTSNTSTGPHTPKHYRHPCYPAPRPEKWHTPILNQAAPA